MGTCMHRGSTDQQTESRLSIKRCRQLLPGSEHLSDDEVRALRDQLYALADIVVAVREEQKANPSEETAQDIKCVIPDLV